jgi:hypothetical protein
MITKVYKQEMKKDLPFLFQIELNQDIMKDSKDMEVDYFILKNLK